MFPGKVLAILGVALASSACTNLASNDAQPVERSQSPAWEPGALYARDGTVVSASSNAQQPAGEAAPRDLRPSESGRMYILELYQKAIDERDALQRELTTLGADLGNSQAQLSEAQRQIAVLQARVAELEAENKRSLDQNVDLAGRLVTAQIRRLQTEKILLEQRIEQKREDAAQDTKQP